LYNLVKKNLSASETRFRLAGIRPALPDQESPWPAAPALPATAPCDFISLHKLLALYAWHGPHYVAHIAALRERKGWK